MGIVFTWEGTSLTGLANGESGTNTALDDPGKVRAWVPGCLNIVYSIAELLKETLERTWNWRFNGNQNG